MAPATAREIATDLVVTEAAVKQHLLRLYQKFRIAEGQNRRTRLANEVVALGLVRPLPPPGRAGPAVAGAGAPPGTAIPAAMGAPPGTGIPAAMGAPPGTGAATTMSAAAAAGTATRGRRRQEQRPGPARHLPVSPSSRMDRRGGTRLPRGTPDTNGSPTARRASARAAGPSAIP